ncbi:hypothetical protein BGY98DRAFT_1037760 [Russula aff. rugulosa BPL654]|jgi:hypothetical protein|nr:hypothetical protein BGY98DRAFT_1037760 [Russula aff. rugulosa BPL654]
MIFVAMVRSRVSPSLMACSHLPLIYWSVGVSFPLTLLQLRTQTKWVVSETSVERCRRQVGLGAGSSIGVLDSELVGCLEGWRPRIEECILFDSVHNSYLCSIGWVSVGV